MKKNGILSRLKDIFLCFGAVVLDGLRSFLPWNRAPRAEASALLTTTYFPPGDWRRDVLNDFAAWLKELDSSNSAPPDIDLSHDLFEVLTELSAFRQEIKRQSREQSKLNEELDRMDELYREALARVNTTAGDLSSLKQDVERGTEKTVFLLFADLRDALQRGLDGVRVSTGQESFFRKLPPAWKAVREGYELALARFDRAMAHLGIRKVETCGSPFDSRFMVAVATRHEPGVEGGTVLEESLSGYFRGEEVLRTAQVVVASDATE